RYLKGEGLNEWIEQTRFSLGIDVNGQQVPQVLDTDHARQTNNEHTEDNAILESVPMPPKSPLSRLPKRRMFIRNKTKKISAPAINQSDTLHTEPIPVTQNGVAVEVSGSTSIEKKIDEVTIEADDVHSRDNQVVKLSDKTSSQSSSTLLVDNTTIT